MLKHKELIWQISHYGITGIDKIVQYKVNNMTLVNIELIYQYQLTAVYLFTGVHILCYQLMNAD